MLAQGLPFERLICPVLTYVASACRCRVVQSSALAQRCASCSTVTHSGRLCFLAKISPRVLFSLQRRSMRSCVAIAVRFACRMRLRTDLMRVEHMGRSKYSSSQHYMRTGRSASLVNVLPPIPLSRFSRPAPFNRSTFSRLLELLWVPGPRRARGPAQGLRVSLRHP